MGLSKKHSPLTHDDFDTTGETDQRLTRETRLNKNVVEHVSAVRAGKTQTTWKTMINERDNNPWEDVMGQVQRGHSTNENNAQKCNSTRRAGSTTHDHPTEGRHTYFSYSVIIKRGDNAKRTLVPATASTILRCLPTGAKGVTG